jgi:hypothetical protein
MSIALITLFRKMFFAFFAVIVCTEEKCYFLFQEVKLNVEALNVRSFVNFVQ